MEFTILIPGITGGKLANIQHVDARKLLTVISAASKKKEKLTYQGAAELMGRVPARNHARAIAQMCDLLDAAACLAGIPLLALVAVLDSNSQINPKAWKKEYGPRREAIIQRSLDHVFTSSDYAAISATVADFGQRGNRKAWRYLESLYPGDLLYRRLTGAYTASGIDAIDDLGSDTPDRAMSQVWSYARDPRVRAAVLKRAQGKCELCGKPGFVKSDGTRYLESHHVISLANEGADKLTNVIGLCPNDHREAHYGETAEALEQTMILRLQALSSGAPAHS